MLKGNFEELRAGYIEKEESNQVNMDEAIHDLSQLVTEEKYGLAKPLEELMKDHNGAFACTIENLDKGKKGFVSCLLKNGDLFVNLFNSKKEHVSTLYANMYSLDYVGLNLHRIQKLSLLKRRKLQVWERTRSEHHLSFNSFLTSNGNKVNWY